MMRMILDYSRPSTALTNVVPPYAVNINHRKHRAGRVADEDSKRLRATTVHSKISTPVIDADQRLDSDRRYAKGFSSSSPSSSSNPWWSPLSSRVVVPMNVPPDRPTSDVNLAPVSRLEENVGTARFLPPLLSPALALPSAPAAPPSGAFDCSDGHAGDAAMDDPPLLPGKPAFSPPDPAAQNSSPRAGRSVGPLPEFPLEVPPLPVNSSRGVGDVGTAPAAPNKLPGGEELVDVPEPRDM
ncbi:unnamed protein product, partial [Ectocarpus sp. 12 AP-2014]